MSTFTREFDNLFFNRFLLPDAQFVFSALPIPIVQNLIQPEVVKSKELS